MPLICGKTIDWTLKVLFLHKKNFRRKNQKRKLQYQPFIQALFYHQILDIEILLIESQFLLESGRFDIFEIVIVSKILIFLYFASCVVKRIPEFSFKFLWLVPKLWLIKIWAYFQQNLIFGWKSNFDTNYIQKPT